MSETTKKYRVWAIITTCLSVILLAGPLGYYLVSAFIQGEPVQKLTLSLTTILAVIMIVINLMMKIHLRSTLWVVLLGIALCIEHITPLLIMMAVSTMLEELVCQPIHKWCANHYQINKEIDKRM